MNIRDYAVIGAAHRVAELEQEIAAIKKEFPEVGESRRRETLAKNLALARDAKARKRAKKG